MGFETENDTHLPGLAPASCDGVWFLAYTRPRLESLARQNLELQGFDAYLPLYKHLKNNDVSMAAVFEPMFPRYVFFRPARSGQSIAPVRSTRGVAQVVSFGPEMATIGSSTLDVIRQLERERNAADPVALSSLSAGKVVRFRDPAFAGLQGLVKSVSSRRVAVLLELMGRPQEVSVEHHQLEAA